MKAVIKYVATDPYYSDQVQTFIGVNAASITNQIDEFESWLGKEHSNGMYSIYEPKTLHDDRDEFDRF